MDSRTSSGRLRVGMITDTSGQPSRSRAGPSVMGVLLLGPAAPGRDPVAQHEGQADRRDDETVTPGHVGAPGFVGPKGYLTVPEPGRISGEAMAAAQHDPPVTDVSQVRRRRGQADSCQCRLHRRPRMPDELLITHPGDPQATPAEQPGLALDGYPPGGRHRG